MGKWILLMMLVTAAAANGWAQQAGAAKAGARARAAGAAEPRAAALPRPAKRRFDSGPGPRAYSPGAFFRDVAGDQASIWRSPARLRGPDAFWLAPLVGVGGALLATDSEVSRHLSNSPSRLNRSAQISTVAVGTLIGAGAGLYLWGKLTRNRHQQETGFLSMESLADALIVNNAVNLAAGRERPLADNARGRFGVGGRSFPSNHAVSAWAVASVVAHEYPGTLTKLLAYGLAAAVSGTRVSAKQHFPSDVLVGSAIGWLVGQQVYRSRHDPGLGGEPWNTFRELHGPDLRSPRNFGSPYVPLDSWVYPAFERLAAMGYVRSEMLGMRPWTRLECARLLDEAQNRMDMLEADPPATVLRTYQALKTEFRADLALLGGGANRTAELERVYARVGGIRGEPLRDGYHFGQTLTNDYGRPYGEGANAVAGFSGWGTLGPLVGYVRAEYQYAPGSPALPVAAREAAGAADYLPTMPALGTPGTSRFRLLEGYVGMKWEDWQLTFGKQSLWWGPGEGGPMMFSDNAEPVNMFRIARVSPFKLPSIFGLLGPIRTEFFIGQLGGHEFIYHQPPVGLVGQYGVPLADQPLIHGQKISFKPTPNLEFGFSRTTIFGGGGYPVTWHTFLRSLVSTTNQPGGAANKPGDRRSGFDLTYRLPGLRNWVTFYTDSFADDEFSPVAYFDRSANSAGLYFPRLPKLPKLDLRVEGVYTDNPIAIYHEGNLCCGFYYFNDTWRGGYTNQGNLLGSWVGRDGQGIEAWATYWQSPRSYVRLHYRHQKISQQFLPGGGTVNDGGVQASFWLGKKLSATAAVQYEKWNIPVLGPGATSNLSISAQVTYWPRWRVH